MFTKLTTREITVTGAEAELRSIYDLFSRHKPEESRTLRLLIKAGAGFGKTTLSREIVRCMTFDEQNPRFKLMVFLQLRNHTLDTGINTAIREALVPKQYHGQIEQSDISCFLKDNENAIAFVLDGFDEASFSQIPDDAKKEKEPMIIDIIEKKAYLGACVIVTTRPHAVKDLELFMNVLVNIIGFSREQAREYIEKIRQNFESSPQLTSESILQELDKRALQELARNPMLLKMICFLWDCQSQKLGSTETQIYNDFTDLLFDRYRKKCHSFANDTEVVGYLEKLAWKALKQRQLHFTEAEIISELGQVAGQILEHGIGSGILYKDLPTGSFSKHSAINFFSQDSHGTCSGPISDTTM
jgi:hypothetical protein